MILFIAKIIIIHTVYIKLGMLPLMCVYELADILFFIKSLQFPNNSFNILDFITFSNNPTRLFGSKLIHKSSSTNFISNTYSYRLPRLWNSLPVIDTSLSIQLIKKQLSNYFWIHFVNNFDVNNNCTLHYLCPCCKCSKLACPVNFHLISS